MSSSSSAESQPQDQPVVASGDQNIPSDQEYENYIKELSNSDFTSDDYYLNPLIRDTQNIFGDDTLTKMLKSLETVPETPIPNDLADILGVKTTAQTKVSSIVSDPFYSATEGKFVRFGRYFITNVEVPQNQSWTGYQDYYEDGRLMGFSISCNDADMIPVVFVENAVGSKDIINDLSFKEATLHGRGMTYGEATSQLRLPEGFTTRDVVGQKSSLFPYVARFKDTFTGTDTEYENIKGTVNDKYYTMNFEPDVFVPYRRLYFDVYNGSGNGIRLIHRLEIKRLIITPVDEYTSDAGKDSEFTQFNKVLMGLVDKFASKKNPATQVLENLPLTTPAAFARQIRQPSPNLFDEFIKFMYGKVNEKNVTRAYIHNSDKLDTPNLDRIVVNDPDSQRQLQALKRQIIRESQKSPAEKALDEMQLNEDQDGVMVVRFD